MAMNRNWYAKKRLEEQLKFFGAKKTRFISRYAKKPRVRVCEKRPELICNDNNRDYIMNRGMTALMTNISKQHGLGMLAAQQRVAAAQMESLSIASNIQRQAMNTARGDILSCLIGGAIRG